MTETPLDVFVYSCSQLFLERFTIGMTLFFKVFASFHKILFSKELVYTFKDQWKLSASPMWRTEVGFSFLVLFSRDKIREYYYSYLYKFFLKLCWHHHWCWGKFLVCELSATLKDCEFLQAWLHSSSPSWSNGAQETLLCKKVIE